MPKLTVLIPCKDERQHIADCVASARTVADEVIVADSGSTDGSLELVRRLGFCRILQREYVNSANFKNWAIPQATHDWVLVLDADERLSPKLAAEIKVLLAGNPSHDGYSLRRDNYFLGRRIRYCGWNTSRLVRLFRRSVARYQTRRVHADVDVSTGNVASLKHPLLHFTALELDRFIAKQQRYANWSAQDSFEAGKKASLPSVLLHAPLRFLQLYLLRGGILDGGAGALLCGVMSYYTFLKRAKLWELQQKTMPVPQTNLLPANGCVASAS